MEIILITATSKNGVIGVDGKMPWHIPEELKFFKETTMGHPVIMGRKTFESIGSKPLPGRENIVISTTLEETPDITVISDIEELIANKDVIDDIEKVFVIGGAEIYKLFLPHADKLYLTLVDLHIPFDKDKVITKFPTEYLDIFTELEETIYKSKESDIEFKVHELNRIDGRNRAEVILKGIKRGKEMMEARIENESILEKNLNILREKEKNGEELFTKEEQLEAERLMNDIPDLGEPTNSIQEHFDNFKERMVEQKKDID